MAVGAYNGSLSIKSFTEGQYDILISNQIGLDELGVIVQERIKHGSEEDPSGSKTEAGPPGTVFEGDTPAFEED